MVCSVSHFRVQPVCERLIIWGMKNIAIHVLSGRNRPEEILI